MKLVNIPPTVVEQAKAFLDALPNKSEQKSSKQNTAR